MSVFTKFNDRLPDPTFGVNDAGAVDPQFSGGPGFTEVSVSSNTPTSVNRTVSGRGVHRQTGQHFWSINISYSPMLRDHFDVVSSFLEARGGKLNPFFVVLPQYSRPKNPVFATFAAANVIRAATNTAPGSSELLVQASAALVGAAKLGDFITITDPNDINHLKAYKIVGVETANTYKSGTTAPGVNQMRLHLHPPLTRFTAVNAVINFINPKFRVYQTSDILESKLNTDNLYSFGLNLEEILP